jgi:drug/metabolite transporter (DMT)-like permease
VVLIGDSLALASAFLFALANIAVAKAGSKRSVDSGVLLSIVLTVILSALPFFLLSGPVLDAGANVLASLGWFAASGILATVWGRSTLFRAVQFAGVIRATTIRRLTPIFSIIFGWVLLGEGISTWVGLGVALMTLSFALLYADNRKQLVASEPAPGANLPRGYMFGMICALAYATSYVVRKRGLEVFPDPYFGALIGALAALFYYFLGALFSKRMSGVVRAVFVRPDAWQFLAALSISAGQVSQFIALSYIGVGRLAVINSCEVFLASYLAVFIFRTESWPSRLVMAATLVATAGIIFVAAG